MPYSRNGTKKVSVELSPLCLKLISGTLMTSNAKFVFSRLARLRQLCLHPALTDANLDHDPSIEQRGVLAEADLAPFTGLLEEDGMFASLKDGADLRSTVASTRKRYVSVYN